MARDRSYLPAPHLPPPAPGSARERCRPHSEVLGPPSPSAPSLAPPSLWRHRGRRRLADGAVAPDTSSWAAAAELNFGEGKRATGSRRPSLAPPPPRPVTPPSPRAPDRPFFQLPRSEEFPPEHRALGILLPIPGPVGSLGSTRSPAQRLPPSAPKVWRTLGPPLIGSSS